MLSIRQAAANGIRHLRCPQWVNLNDYITLDLIDDGEGGTCLGPWLHLHSPMNEEIHGRDPVDILLLEVDRDAEVWEIWECANPAH